MTSAVRQWIPQDFASRDKPVRIHYSLVNCDFTAIVHYLSYWPQDGPSREISTAGAVGKIFPEFPNASWKCRNCGLLD